MTGVKDVYSGSAGTQIRADNISWFETAVQMESGLVKNNYIHNPGFIAGDHTNGVMPNGGTTLLTITHNTIFNPLPQTHAAPLLPDFSAQANRTGTTTPLACGG